MTKRPNKKQSKSKKYSRRAKNFTRMGFLLVLLLVVVVALTNRYHADTDFRQGKQDLIMYLTANTQVSQSLPGESCWNHKFSLPLVVELLPSDATELILDVNISSADSPTLVLETTKVAILEGKNAITFRTPKAPVGNPNCQINFASNASQDLFGLWISEGNTIDGGTLYFNGQPADYDLVFNSYKPIQFDGLLSAFGNALLPTVQLLGLSLLTLVTGLGIQILLKKEADKLRLILGLFLGIASVMMMVLVLSIFNIRYASWMLFVWAGIFIAAAVIKLLVKREQFKPLKEQVTSLTWQDGLIAFGFVLLLLVRIAQTDQLHVPSWMDSLFHANLIEGFIEQGQIPANLNYHFGYHLLTFLNTELFDWNIPTSMLMTGQWLNVLFSLGLFSFIERRFKNHSLAVFSTLLFSLFAIFPAYLVNWSRFSILLGSAFALVITGNLFQDGQKWSLCLILTTGMLLLTQFLSHYTSIVLTGFIGLVLSYPQLKRFNLNKLKEEFKEKIPLGILIGAGVVLLAIGAFVISRIISMAQAGEFADIFTSSQHLTEQFSFRYFWNLSADVSGWFFLLMSAAGILLALFTWKKARETRFFQTTWIWFGFLVLFVSLQVVILGGSQPSLTNVFIWATIPMTISGGLFLSKLLAGMNAMFPKYKPFTGMILIALLSLVGIIISPVIINPLTVMYTDADQQAIDWMQANLTEEDWILINTQPFEDRLQPSDGGGWIPYLSDLKITYPNPVEMDDFAAWFSSINIDYLYQGSNGLNYDLDALQEEYTLIPVFNGNGIIIYEVMKK